MYPAIFETYAPSEVVTLSTIKNGYPNPHNDNEALFTPSKSPKGGELVSVITIIVLILIGLAFTLFFWL